MTDISSPSAGRAGRFAARSGLILGVLVAAFAVAAMAGPRYGLLLLIGLGFGMALEGFRFGFAGPWRAMILRREPQGLLAQLLAIGLVALVAFPLLQSNAGELSGAHAPVGFAMIGGAFVFGAAMQVVLGCGSGTLVNAGSGNAVGALALVFFALGSFAGSLHLGWWTGLGSAPVLALSGMEGLGITLAGLAVVAVVAIRLGTGGSARLPRRLVLAAIAIAVLAILNLIVAGQPWGVVYGLGLWAAKGAQAVGMEVSANAFWAAPGNAERLASSILTDVTSLTNLGILGGAFLVAAWRQGLSAPVAKLPLKAWAAVVVAGLLLGYSSRLAFGCNVGAFFSGVSTGSLHGWVWFAAAFAGSFYGIKLRPLLGLEPRQ
ncbi:YeeE/YedE family protein [Szabonella alba]|uniref:YeeE/YedE family protein n=1 Tax=Szabonella alba TaxID=2804194 RepID=A0A8K0Y0V5_9RHOB|nr:YeeE/YedE family protein [Szabonella alba]